MPNISALHDHPVMIFVGAACVIAILQNEKARLVSTLLLFIVAVIALAQILGFSLAF